MLEEEAKTKWCPFTRAVMGYQQGSTYPFNRFVSDPKDKDTAKVSRAINESQATRCIGSQCMMWEHEWKRNTDGVSGWVKTKEGDSGLKTKELQCNV